jgi:hypothetical protein
MTYPTDNELRFEVQECSGQTDGHWQTVMECPTLVQAQMTLNNLRVVSIMQRDCDFRIIEVMA